jgi:hypothetical protein
MSPGGIYEFGLLYPQYRPFLRKWISGLHADFDASLSVNVGGTKIDDL